MGLTTETSMGASLECGDLTCSTKLPPGIASEIASGIQGQPGINGVSEYAYLYNIVKVGTIAVGSSFPFDSGTHVTSAFAHTRSPVYATSAPITILKAGVYSALWTVTVAEAREVGLFLNSNVLTNSVYGSSVANSVTTGISVFNANVNDVLTLRNYASVGALTLVTPSGGTANNATNSILILKLA